MARRQIKFIINDDTPEGRAIWEVWQSLPPGSKSEWGRNAFLRRINGSSAPDGETQVTLDDIRAVVREELSHVTLAQDTTQPGEDTKAAKKFAALF